MILGMFPMPRARTAQPTIATVSPGLGPEAGGTSFVITGTGFIGLSGGAAVKVGANNAASYVVDSSTKITAVTPPGAGTVDVTVTTTIGSVVKEDAFAYQAAVSALRGTNLVGMESDYQQWNQATGPVAGDDYPVFDLALIDYLHGKGVSFLRFLMLWEGFQSALNGSVPASATGNYGAYWNAYKTVLDYATSLGMRVAIGPWQVHADGSTGGAEWRGQIIGQGTVTAAHFANFWGKVAAAYASNPRVDVSLINEPHDMSTMGWFAAAQAAITAIRAAGFTGTIYVPGNGYTSATSWEDDWYDTDPTPRSNAYGWLNANGVGQPLSDPLNKLVAEVHNYMDSDQSGGSTEVVSDTAAKDQMAGVVAWGRAHDVKFFVGEIGMYAAATNAAACWADFAAYAEANDDVIAGWAWWACGDPDWWNDIAADGGGHFAITPTAGYTTDTVNMDMIESSL